MARVGEGWAREREGENLKEAVRGAPTLMRGSVPPPEITTQAQPGVRRLTH